MFGNTVRKAAEAAEDVVLEPVDLVSLGELCAEGFGYDPPRITAPRDVIAAVARQLDGEVLLDDLGRQCVPRDTARRLLAERAEAERRWREEQERHEAELAQLDAANRPLAGIPIPEGMEGADAVTVMRQRDIEAATERKGALQRATLDEMFSGGLAYHPIADREES